MLLLLLSFNAVVRTLSIFINIEPIEIEQKKEEKAITFGWSMISSFVLFVGFSEDLQVGTQTFYSYNVMQINVKY